MPPLVLLVVSSFVVVCALSRLWMLQHKHETRDLPFITDITHGICPRCGDTHPEARKFAAKHATFWQSFNCKCGFAVKTHLRDVV